MCTVALFVY